MLTAIDLVPVSGFVGLAVGELHFYVLRKRERILRNAHRMDIAAENLDRHMEAFDRFYADAGSPQELRDVLFYFSEAISRAETAMSCAEGLTTHPNQDISEDAKHVLSVLSTLRLHRPDLAASFDAAIMSGLVYMLYRWPETYKLLEDATSRIATDPTRGVGFATRAARMAKPKSAYGPQPAFAAA